MNDDELEPLPDAIIVEIPRLTAVVLWAVAQVEDRSIEYIASQWLQKTAKGQQTMYAEYEKSLAKTLGDNAAAIERQKQRQAMTPTMRLAVLNRDGFKCVYCGAIGKENKLHVDHIVPIIDDGKTVMENLQVLCADCNIGKSTKPDFLKNVVKLARK